MRDLRNVDVRFPPKNPPPRPRNSSAESETSLSEEGTCESDSRYGPPADDEDEYYEEGDEYDTSSTETAATTTYRDETEVVRTLAAFRKCDEFLQRHKIRPEYFCRYKERLALQAWLLQRLSHKVSKRFPGKFK